MDTPRVVADVWMVNKVFITGCIVSLRGTVWKNNMVHSTDFAKKLVQIHKCLKGDSETN